MFKDKYARIFSPQMEAIVLPWVPEVFFSLGATELSGEAESRSGEKKPLAPTNNNLTSMPTPISFD